jgi:DNA polymerase III delta prime subunit
LDARQSTYNTKDQPPYIPSGQEQNTFAFDVYARPYVPSWLQSVNEEPAENNVVTEVKHAIRYGAYINKFAGKDFLAQHPSLISEWLRDDVPFVAQLSEQSYIEHFTSLLKRECLARKRVNEQYALYMVSLQAIPTPDGNCLWALSVPGLREDNPLVQMGDDLQIRQIWVDLGGNPIQIPVQMDNAGSTYFVQKSWTGKQYNAAVCSVSRVNETVYLRIDGLAHLFLYPNQNTLPMFVNVVFPLKQRTLQGQLRALQSTGHSLKQTSRGQEDVAITNGFSAFSESLLQIDESSSHRVPSAAPRNDWMRRMLFPTNLDGQLQTQLRGVPHRALFDHAINYEQAHAVNSICATDYGTLPYLISGPPGTGKTKTLVEIAMQLLNTTDVVHMLVCAPSEAAADTLAIRLKQYLTPKQLLRLNGPNRADNEVPRELMQYCYIQNDMFYLPPFKKLMSFSVVVTSCRDAAMLAEARLTNADLWSLERDIVSTLHPEEELPTPSLHWGALLLDEAAQATEVDALPAISVVCPPSGYRQDRAQPRLVMAGDENQLGPRTASHDPQFATSLFARLFSRPLFAKHPLSRSNVKPSSGPPVLKRSMLPILYPPFTNLIRNYRSHPAILSVPSSRFYHDTLIPEAPITHTPLQASSLWRGRKWPVLYIPHIGTDEIERDNGGWYNISEARLACSLARTLVYDSAVRQQDICIMSPFAAQVKILRSMIRSHQHGGGNGLWDVNIGPVEAFQGLEKRVVIICTTRTRTRFVENDVKMEMGLVGQKQKMNVALTRAKEALFVIGSPEVLGGDEHWRDWMAYCLRNGLVDDPHGVWKDKEEFRVGKVGVLERALVAREEGQREKQWPALGAGAAEHDIDGGEYEAFAESLRQALEEEDLEDYEEEEDDTLEHEATEL